MISKTAMALCLSYAKKAVLFLINKYKNTQNCKDHYQGHPSSGTKCVKNKPRYIIKMREMRGEVGKKTPKKEIYNTSFL